MSSTSLAVKAAPLAAEGGGPSSGSLAHADLAYVESCPLVFSKLFTRGLECGICVRWSQVGPVRLPREECPVMQAARLRPLAAL